jgi:peptidoglycan/LPS O-acetylase OafA/YrhL
MISKVFGGIGLALIIWFLPSSILIYSLIWLMGAALYFVNHRQLLPLWISLMLFAASFFVARLQVIAVPRLADFLIGISFALVINSAAAIKHRLPFNVWSRNAAGFSYSVYLCHFPFLLLTLSVFYQKGWIAFRKQPTPGLALVFVLVLLVVYFWCFMVSLMMERQTPRIRNWLNRSLSRKLAFATKVD